MQTVLLVPSRNPLSLGMQEPAPPPVQPESPHDAPTVEDDSAYDSVSSFDDVHKVVVIPPSTAPPTPQAPSATERPSKKRLAFPQTAPATLPADVQLADASTGLPDAPTPPLLEPAVQSEPEAGLPLKEETIQTTLAPAHVSSPFEATTSPTIDHEPKPPPVSEIHEAKAPVVPLAAAQPRAPPKSVRPPPAVAASKPPSAPSPVDLSPYKTPKGRFARMLSKKKRQEYRELKAAVKGAATSGP